jgi:hypothetical protein
MHTASAPRSSAFAALSCAASRLCHPVLAAQVLHERVARLVHPETLAALAASLCVCIALTSGRCLARFRHRPCRGRTNGTGDIHASGIRASGVCTHGICITPRSAAPWTAQPRRRLTVMQREACGGWPPVRCRHPFALSCFSTAKKRGNRHRGGGATTLTGPTCSGVVLRQCPPGAVCTVASPALPITVALGSARDSSLVAALARTCTFTQTFPATVRLYPPTVPGSPSRAPQNV